MKWEKNCGDQRNCGNRLEKEIKKKNVRLVKNYKNKNTQTNKLIISTMSKETTHFFRKKKKGNKPFWNWRWWWSKQKVEAIQKLMQKNWKETLDIGVMLEIQTILQNFLQTTNMESGYW